VADKCANILGPVLLTSCSIANAFPWSELRVSALVNLKLVMMVLQKS
jgi:hypothetical protein